MANPWCHCSLEGERKHRANAHERVIKQELPRLPGAAGGMRFWKLRPKPTKGAFGKAKVGT